MHAAPAGRLTVGGFAVMVPGFTPASFDRAIKRAQDEGFTVAATDRGDMVLVVKPAYGTAYTVTRQAGPRLQT